MTATGNKRLALRAVPFALFALTPKCLLCVAGYAGLGAALGLGGPELCGGGDTTGHWTVWLAGLGSAAGVAGFLTHSTRPSLAGPPYKTTGRSASQPRSE